MKILEEMRERAADLSAMSQDGSLPHTVAADALALILTLRGVMKGAERMREERDHYRTLALLGDHRNSSDSDKIAAKIKSAAIAYVAAEQAMRQALGGRS